MSSRLSAGPPGNDEYVPPQAHSYEVAFCNHCPNAHVLLLDEDGHGIAQMTISQKQAINLLAKILVNDTIGPSEPK